LSSQICLDEFFVQSNLSGRIFLSSQICLDEFFVHSNFVGWPFCQIELCRANFWSVDVCRHTYVFFGCRFLVCWLDRCIENSHCTRCLLVAHRDDCLLRHLPLTVLLLICIVPVGQ
jgi:hypothetical protein